MPHLGQHFLRNPGILKNIASSIPDTLCIIEIGPGHGELTFALRTIHPKAKILCIERDPTLAAHLQERFSTDKNIQIIEGNALDELSKTVKGIKAEEYSLVGNIPYYITGHLFRTLGELAFKPLTSVFLIQKEVAKRATAKPPMMNRLAASVQFWGKPSILFNVSKSNFNPPPKIESAVIKIDLLDEKDQILRPTERDLLLQVIFQQPRKTILNNLAEANKGISREILAKKIAALGLNPKNRPQNLSIREIALLNRIIA